MHSSLSLVFLALTSLVGVTHAAPADAASTKSPSTRVVLYRNADCLTLDVFPSDDSVAVTCQDTLTDVMKPMHAFNKYQSGDSTCAVGDFKSFYVQGDVAAFDSLVS